MHSNYQQPSIASFSSFSSSFFTTFNMPPGSKRDLVYSNATSIGVQDDGFFPLIYQPANRDNRYSYHDQGHDITEEQPDDTSSSIQNFGDIFRQHTNNTTTNKSEYDLSARLNLFQTHFDSDSEGTIALSPRASEEESRISLDSSIIDKFNDKLVTDSKLNPFTDDRFHYLNMYQRLKKDKNTSVKVNHIMDQMKNQSEIPLETPKDTASITTSNSSIFNLSKLDDYNKYVKLTEINDKIHQKYLQRLPSNQDSNLLSIVKTKDLTNNFYTNNEDYESKAQSKSTKPKPSWYSIDWMKQKKDKELNANQQTKVSYVVADSLSPSSNSLKDEESQRLNQPKYLQRKLKVRHLQMISFGGTLGVGLFLNSGKALTIAGGFGTLLAFVICGIIVLTTIISFCEMVTFISVVDGVSGLSSRFVDDSFGFSVGWLYFLSFAFGLAGEVVASVILLTYFPSLKVLQNKGSTVGFVTLFLALILAANLVDVRVFGEIEYISSFIKLICALIMIIIMIVLNRGGIGQSEVLGFKYWQYLKSDFDHNLIFGLFRPSFNLHDNGTSPPSEGVGSDTGRFLSLLTAIMVVSYAYSGTEIVCIAACEAQSPRKALPSATRRVFWRILIFYCLSSFLVSLNIYSGDPRLLRYYSGSTGVSSSEFNSNYAIQYVGGEHCNSNSAIFAGFGSGSQSPWTIALQSVGLCKFSSIANAFLVFFAVSCGNAQLYVSSRTMYSLALQKKAPKCMAYCTRYGIPYNAVLFSASFGLLSFLVVSEKATVVFQNLTGIIASSGIIVWFAMCLSYLRFYYGLKIRPDIISRDDKAYPYKSPFQPYSAIIGLVGSGVIILGMGFVVFLKDEWDTLFFFSCYGTLIVFAILYVAYRLIRGTRIPSLETLDFDSGRREIDRYIWDGGKDYNTKSVKEVVKKGLSALA